jgi:guanylate kinase
MIQSTLEREQPVVRPTAVSHGRSKIDFDPKLQIISFTGPSAVGKNSVIRELRRIDPRLEHIIPSFTTRDPRDDDQPGEYVHLTEKKFTQLDEGEGAFQWTRKVHGNRYGTKRDHINAAMRSRVPHMIHVVPSCVCELHEHAGDQVVFFFIYVDDPAVLRDRITRRNPTMPDDEREERVQSCLNWYAEAQASGLPYTFINNTYELALAVNDVVNVLERKLAT